MVRELTTLWNYCSRLNFTSNSFTNQCQGQSQRINLSVLNVPLFLPPVLYHGSAFHISSCKWTMSVPKIFSGIHFLKIEFPLKIIIDHSKNGVTFSFGDFISTKGLEFRDTWGWNGTAWCSALHLLCRAVLKFNAANFFSNMLLPRRSMRRQA